MKRLPQQIEGVIFVCIGIILFLSLFSFTPSDIKWISAPYNESAHNLIGLIGSYTGFFLFFLFGVISYFFPFYFLLKGLEKLSLIRFHGISGKKWVNAAAFFLFLLFLSSFVGIFFQDKSSLYGHTGFFGFFLSRFFHAYLGFWGSFIALGILMLISSTIFFGYFFLDVFAFIRSGFFKLKNLFVLLKRRITGFLSNKSRDIKEQINERKLKKEAAPAIKIYTSKRAARTPPPVQEEDGEEEEEDESGLYDTGAAVENKKVSRDKIKEQMESLDSRQADPFDPAKFKLPAIDVLEPPPPVDSRKIKENIKEKIRNLQDALADFGVLAKVVSVQKGPVVTMYELEPQAGVKIQKITTLSDDLALAMKASGVRIVAPIPGRGTVGVEVPNEKKQMVYFREVLEEAAFSESKSKLTLALGKDVKGDPVIADLKEMPHLLIAGATGAGKTVCVNSLVTSILFKAKPNEVKLILIDPKMVELAPYSGIPHLITPIIFEAKKVFSALNWAATEMENRYRLLAKDGVRNIDGYNRREFRMPYIVIVIDELADLMVVARDSIETTIQRLAQLSRAVGIHLIMATQRPSVDVITGVIKANFPARISFKVSSKVDSRTVLDMMGAEKLLGKGDMLFLKPGAPLPIRAQGAYLNDQDIDELTNFLREQGAPVHEDNITRQQQVAGGKQAREDELFEEAVKILLMSKQASASLLQRRLRVGYTRAARLLDLMENEGIVGPFCGSKAREILVDPEEYFREKGWE